MQSINGCDVMVKVTGHMFFRLTNNLFSNSEKVQGAALTRFPYFEVETSGFPVDHEALIRNDPREDERLWGFDDDPGSSIAFLCNTLGRGEA